MFDIRIDTSALTFTQFIIPGVNTNVADGAYTALLSLQPGTYGFQQASGVVADFEFEVTSAGTIDYNSSHDAFLSGRETSTLVIRGFSIFLDTTQLSHSILPMIFGAGLLMPDSVHVLSVVPARAMGFSRLVELLPTSG
jgi:hypothetical protein